MILDFLKSVSVSHTDQETLAEATLVLCTGWLDCCFCFQHLSL